MNSAVCTPVRPSVTSFFSGLAHYLFSDILHKVRVQYSEKSDEVFYFDKSFCCTSKGVNGHSGSKFNTSELFSRSIH